MPQPVQLHLSVYKPHTAHNSSIRSDEGLTLETSAFESLYAGQFMIMYRHSWSNQIALFNQKLFLCVNTFWST